MLQLQCTSPGRSSTYTPPNWLIPVPGSDLLFTLPQFHQNVLLPAQFFPSQNLTHSSQHLLCERPPASQRTFFPLRLRCPPCSDLYHSYLCSGIISHDGLTCLETNIISYITSHDVPISSPMMNSSVSRPRTVCYLSSIYPSA